MLRTSLLDPYHALHMTDLYLSGKSQLNSQSYFKTLRPYPVQLINSKDFLSSPRPSLVQLNRFPTNFSDDDSVEVIFRFFFEIIIPMVLSPTVMISYGPLPDGAWDVIPFQVMISYGPLPDGAWDVIPFQIIIAYWFSSRYCEDGNSHQDFLNERCWS